MFQIVPITGVVMVTTPQEVALADAYKGAAMFGMGAEKIPVLGVVENMSYFTPEELPNNKYYLFGKDGGRHMAESLQVPFLGEVPIYMSIREGGDSGIPAVMVENSVAQKTYFELAQNVAQQVAMQNATKNAAQA